jgi:RNA recognition motif-containing protein
VSFETTQGQLEALFAAIGAVRSVFLPTDRATGRPRGFAFVEFDDSAAAAAAIQRLDGHDLNGRTLRVNEAQDKPQRAPGNFGAPRSFAAPRDFGAAGDFGAPRDFSDGGPPSGGLPRRMRSKGSRRNLRARKRSL